MTLIAIDNHLGVFAAIMTLAGLSFLLERTRLGAQLTGTVMVILAAIAAANAGLIPHSAPAYGFIFSYIVPMLIPLFLFQADLRRLWREASRTSIAFLIAAAGTVAGVMVAAALLDCPLQYHMSPNVTCASVDVLTSAQPVHFAVIV